MIIDEVMIDWQKIEELSYLQKIRALKGVTSIKFSSPVTFFVGENGSGKSTLLEAIAIAYGFNPEGGTKNYDFSTYDSHSNLYEALRLAKGLNKDKWGYFLRAESFYNVATKQIDYKERNSKLLHACSHGESFFEAMHSNFASKGLFLLDEPEAALSPQKQLAILLEMYKSVKLGSQFIVVTHSPILLGYPGAEILTFDEGKVHTCAYEDTLSYKVTSVFLRKREDLLTELFKEE